MSTKPNPLRAAMLGVQHNPPIQPPLLDQPVAAVLKERPATSIAPSRIGKRSVSGHFAPDVARQLRILAAETDRTVQELLEEALNDLFRKHDKSAIA